MYNTCSGHDARARYTRTMRKMNRSTILVGSVTLLAAALFIVTFVRAFLYIPEMEVEVPALAENAPREYATPESLSDRLIIPRLDIDAPVQEVGLTAGGNMGSPSNFTDVGWYKYGAVPGQMGSAVMAGHLDNGLALSGVFKHLEKLTIGDDVFIATKGGQRLHFVVTDIGRYDYKEVPTEKVFTRDDVPRLNLITCSGDWVRSDKTYDERLVIYTSLAAN